MSISLLQEQIRKKKTPLLLGLGPEADRIAPKIRNSFTEMYGESVMATAEALRYHGCQVLDAAAEHLAGVVLDAGAYLRYGAMGFDVLANLVGAAKARGLYTVVDTRGASASVWLAAIPQADAVTVLPWLGGDACDAGEDKAVLALVTTDNLSAADTQRLIAGDRKLFLAAAEQMARAGAGVMLESGYALDIRDVRRKLDKTFLLLTHCTPQAAEGAFDDYGHGAALVDGTIQYSADLSDAVEKAVDEMKEWVTVV
jgi:orotidine-5'-phosphate decarboxylase